MCLVRVTECTSAGIFGASSNDSERRADTKEKHLDQGVPGRILEFYLFGRTLREFPKRGELNSHEPIPTQSQSSDS